MNTHTAGVRGNCSSGWIYLIAVQRMLMESNCWLPVKSINCFQPFCSPGSTELVGDPPSELFDRLEGNAGRGGGAWESNPPNLPSGKSHWI
jgi:hypothetical protein